MPRTRKRTASRRITVARFLEALRRHRGNVVATAEDLRTSALQVLHWMEQLRIPLLD